MEEGPSANLPPHMELESDVRFLMSLSFTMSAFALCACDRQSEEPEQQLAADDASELPPLEDGNYETAGGQLVGKLDRSMAGTPMTEGQFFDPSGNGVTLNAFKGKPLLLNAWATWCGPCVIEMPMLDALAVKEGRLQVLAVSQDSASIDRVAPFFERAQFQKLQPYLDPENAIALGIGVKSMPTTVLYDAEGKEVWRVVGAMDWNGPLAAEILEEAYSSGE